MSGCQRKAEDLFERDVFLTSIPLQVLEKQVKDDWSHAPALYGPLVSTGQAYVTQAGSGLVCLDVVSQLGPDLFDKPGVSVVICLHSLAQEVLLNYGLRR
jgi:hypothetical protein